MNLGIDASNVRIACGGGMTHLKALLETIEPQKFGFNKIILWGPKHTLTNLPSNKPWLKLILDPLLDKPLPFRIYWQKFQLPKLARNSCDILFIPGGGSGNGFNPYITMSQSVLPFEPREIFRYGFSWMFMRLILLRFNQTKSFRDANGVIFLSEYGRSLILNATKINNTKSKIIPHGIDNRFFSTPRSQKIRSSYSFSNPFRFLYVSTIDFYKHQWNVAKAIAILRKEKVPVVVDLVGSAYPPALKYLKKVLRRVDPHRKFVNYQGPVPHAILHSCYHGADAFIFASSCESFPIILHEAMASGLPIACSNRGTMPELLGNEGIYFDPEKPYEMAEAMYALFENSDLCERYAWGAYKKATNYSWERCANETLEFIRNIMGRKGKTVDIRLS